MPTVNLTDAFVKGAKGGKAGGLAEFRDTLLPGLELRVTDRGSKSWRLHYTRRSDGRRRAVALGSYPSIGLKEARRRAKQLQAEIEDEEKRADPAGRVKVRREAETFEELAQTWIERHGQPNKCSRAVQDDRSMLDRHIYPEIGQMKAREMTKRDVIRLLDKVASKSDARQSGKPKARRLTHRPNRVFELVRAIFRWAVGRDLLIVDPTFGVAPPIKIEKPRERELSEAEIRVLWNALDRAPDARRTTKGIVRGTRIVSDDDLPMTKCTALAIKLALVTGQRIGEVTGAAISELSLNVTAPLWTIPGDRSKNGQPNRVPLSPLAVRLIQEARELFGDRDWLFPGVSGQGPVDPHAPTKALARARAVIGLEDFRIHDLRRTAATRMAEMGISPHTISMILNHVSATRGTITAKVYNQYSYDREKREALVAWGVRLEEIIGGDDREKVVPLRRVTQ
jgi:integrase